MRMCFVRFEASTKPLSLISNYPMDPAGKLTFDSADRRTVSPRYVYAKWHEPSRQAEMTTYRVYGQRAGYRERLATIWVITYKRFLSGR